MSIAIVGSSGNVGAATLKALEAYPRLDVRVGVRDVNKLKNLPANFKVVHADFNDSGSVEQLFNGVHTAFIIAPGTRERAVLTINAINSAVLSKVQHIVVVSVASVAAKTAHFFQHEFRSIEYAVKASKLHYTLLRLPLFVDNNWGNVDTIKGQGTIYAPAAADNAYAPVVVSDVGEAAAKILSNPSAHQNKTYLFTVPTAISHNETAAGFSAALGKPIKYVQVPYDAAKQAFLGKGYPEWQVDGILELYHLIDNKDPSLTVASNDLATVLGHPATSFNTWASNVKGGFQ